jgi:hypothetical protein
MSMSFEATRERLTQILLLTPEENMYADVLDLLLGLFESEFGYFGYINPEGQGARSVPARRSSLSSSSA